MLPRGACTKQPRKHKLREGSFLSEKRSSQQQFRRSCAHVVFFFISPFTPVAATFFFPRFALEHGARSTCSGSSFEQYHGLIFVFSPSFFVVDSYRLPRIHIHIKIKTMPFRLFRRLPIFAGQTRSAFLVALLQTTSRN